MKTYFENRRHIIPFSKVITIYKFFDTNEVLYKINVCFNNDLTHYALLEGSAASLFCERYKAWLEGEKC